MMSRHLLLLGTLLLACTARADIGIDDDDDEPEDVPVDEREQITRIPQADDGSFTGYLTDIYCWDIRYALDGADMLLEPERHTVHCLRDIDVCIDSGYGVLDVADSGTEYFLKYRFDAAGNAAALAYVKETRKTNNVIVVVKGNFKGTQVQVTSIEEYTPPEAANQDAGVRGEGVLFAHLICMCLAFGALFPWGVVLASTRKAVGPHAPWFAAHRQLQMFGWAIQLLGFVCAVIFAQNRLSHFNSVHAIFGAVTVGLATLQPLNGLLRPHHADEEGTEKSGARLAWESLHKVVGYVTIVLGYVTISMGIYQAVEFGYDGVTIGVASALAVVAGLPPLICWYVIKTNAFPSLPHTINSWFGKMPATTGEEEAVARKADDPYGGKGGAVLKA